MTVTRVSSDGPGAVPVLPVRRGAPEARMRELPHAGRLQWRVPRRGGLLVIVDGLALVHLDGNPLRLAAPCVIRPLAHTRVDLCNLGRSPLRLLCLGSGYTP